MELNAVPKAKTTVQFEELPGMDEVGLDVPLDPSGALPDPKSQIRAGLFPSRGIQDSGTISVREQPQSQIAILGYVVFVPTADFSKDVKPEVIGGTSERDWRLQAVEPGKTKPEPSRIVRSKAFGEKILVGVVESKLPLNARDVVRASCEGMGSLFQLIRIGLVLGIVDDQVVCLSVFDSHVARLRLGSWVGFRDWDDDERRLEVKAFGDPHCFVVILLDQQPDIEPILWVVEIRESLDEMR